LKDNMKTDNEIGDEVAERIILAQNIIRWQSLAKVRNKHSGCIKCGKFLVQFSDHQLSKYESWNFNSGNYLFTTDTK